MEETKPSAYEISSIIHEEDEGETLNLNGSSNSNHGWQKVVYPKRQRKSQSQAKSSDLSEDILPNGTHVFASVEKKAHERRRAFESAAASAAAEAAGAARSRAIAAASDDDDDDSGVEGVDGGKENGTEEVKKVKQKKPKKPKVTVPEAASKIDPSDLSVFLVEETSSYESQPDIQLMRFADYFARAFSSVSASQFPWMKMFKESPVSKIINVPLCHISESVIKISADWIGQRPVEALGNFVLWSLDSILADLANQQAVVKGSKKPVQQPSSKAQVAIFVALALTLRRKPDVLINILPALRENPKYQGLEKLPVMIWVIGQASQGDLAIGMYGWVHNLLPLVCGKSSVNPQVRDLVLQLAERILSGPKARPVLLNSAVRKGERLVPPFALELLMRATFPAPSARIKATERFEVIYPTLRELALAGSPGSKSIKPVSQQLLPAMVKAIGENNSELSTEATDIFIWCLTQNNDCYKQWEKLHLENVEASVAILRKLSDEWKKYSAKFSPPDSLRETLKNLMAKNKEALAEGEEDFDSPALFRDADRYCKVISGRLTRGSSCMKVGVCFVTVAIAVGAFVVSPKLESWDWKNLYVI